MRLFALLPVVIAATAFGAMETDVPYRTVDAVELRMDIATPEGPGPFPAVVCLHGGGWSMGSKGSFRKIIQGLAENGYVAATIEYRLTPKVRCPAQVDDARAAVHFLRANAPRWKVNPAFVVLMGASAGGHLALLAGLDRAHNDEAVQAVVDVSGPTDLRDWRMSDTADRVLQKTTGKSSQDLVNDLLGPSGDPVAASPVTKVRAGDPPVLIFQWKDDQAVAIEQPQRLIKELVRAAVPHRAVWFEGRGHAFNGPGVERIVPITVEFLNSLASGKR